MVQMPSFVVVSVVAAVDIGRSSKEFSMKPAVGQDHEFSVRDWDLDLPSIN